MTNLLDGSDPHKLGEKELAEFRNRKVGYLFQDHCLLPQCSVLENVLVPTLVAAKSDHEARARNLLARVGLEARLDHRPAELSGGEKQRVAIARALVLNPRLLLCDEPTGNLDSTNTESVLSLFHELEADGLTLVVITHEEDVAAHARRVVRIVDGRLTEVTR